VSAPATCWEDAYRVQTEIIKELWAENAQLRADKARLDWLDEKGCWLTIPGARNFLSGASRAVIDAARKEAQP
jgi:hypothetical protein